MKTFRAAVHSMIGVLPAPLTCLMWGSTASVSAQEKERTRLAGGTVIALRVAQNVNSEMTEGTPIELRVLRDVVVDGRVIIRAGWPGSATVASVKPSDIVGKGGRVTLKLLSVRAIDGQEVFIGGSLDGDGEDRVARSIMLGCLFWPLFFVLEGDDATIPSGTEVRGYVEQDYMIDANGVGLRPTVN